MCKILVFKTLNMRQWRTMIPERWGKNKVSSVLYCVLSLCLTLHPMDRSQSGSSVHGIFQGRILEWVAISYWREIFPNQGSIPCLLWLLCWQADPLSLSHQKSPTGHYWQKLIKYNCPSVSMGDLFQDPLDTKIHGCSSPLYESPSICM